MSSMLNSSNLVFATVMVVSSTVAILTYFRQNKPDISTALPQPSDGATSRQPQVLNIRPCLSSGGRKKERKKKKVQFAENVKNKGVEKEKRITMNMEKELSMKKKTSAERSPRLKKVGCRSGFVVPCRSGSGFPDTMPQNRLPLYNAILRDRSHHRIGFSH